MRLEAMDETCTSTNRGCHVNRFGHLFDVRSGFKTRLRVSVYAIRTLHGVRHGQANEGLLASCECAVLLACLVPCHELFKEIGPVLADIREPIEVFFLVVRHCSFHPSVYTLLSLSRSCTTHCRVKLVNHARGEPQPVAPLQDRTPRKRARETAPFTTPGGA